VIGEYFYNPSVSALLVILTNVDFLRKAKAGEQIECQKISTRTRNQYIQLSKNNDPHREKNGERHGTV
jgi:hypothetical protein